MNRILVLLMAFTLGVSANATKVNSETALTVAKNFMIGRYGQGFSEFSVLEIQPYPHLYLLQNAKGEGFVIVSAEDCITPIVGYSNQGRVDGVMPPSVHAWFMEYERQIAYLLEMEADAPHEIASEWRILSSGEVDENSFVVFDAVPGLLSTTWNQAPYYNNMCPTGTYTGCTATAMAQIMKYWNHPFVGIGQHSYTHATYGIQSANFGNTYYSWSNMPNELVASSSTAQKNAVATLMYHCGVAVNMDYGTNGSGAAVISNGGSYACAENAFKQYFDYKTTLRGLNRNDYESVVWHSHIQTDLNSGRPVLYTGEGEGAHAFIIDGMDNAGRYHVNWGWGGSWDGFFFLDAMQPNPTSDQNNYSFNQRALFGIEPNPTTLKTLPASISMSHMASTDTVWVRSNPQNASSWSASCDQSWLQISTATGLGGGQQTMILLSAAPNTTGNQRAATITITQGTETATVRVLQSDGTHSASGWYGNEEVEDIFFILPSHEYLIRPEVFGNFQQGTQLTKVKFNIYGDTRNRGDSVRVKIYEGNTLPSTTWGTRTQSIGQLAYSQNHPVEAYGIQEVLLDSPYHISDRNFWVAIQPSDTLVLWMKKSYIHDTISISQQNTYSNISGAYLSADNLYVQKMRGFDCLESDSTLVRPYNWMNALSVFVNTDTRYTLQATTSDPVRGSVSSANGEYPNMSSVNIMATALPGFRFKHWSDGSTANPRTLNIWKDTSLVAVFERDLYAIILSVHPNATYGTTVGSGLHRSGDTIQIGAIPFVGYQFSQWSDGNISNPRQLIVSSDTSFSAHFAVLPPDTINIHDTTYITHTDTLTVVQTDTVTLTDTLTVYQIDTLTVYSTDTLWLTDTLYIDRIVHDTVYIHDTVYVSIDDVETVDYMIYQQGGQIVVEGADGQPVAVYDAVGRLLATRRDTFGAVRFEAPVSGAYLVRVGNAAARRIVVVR